ncbi:MAG: redoxin domain-containing protein [Spirochaetaceae bacterium]|nr:redoxin domain-containing protein [Spirochaetaceae bacterium]
MNVAVDQPAPDFVLPRPGGTPLQLSALRGRKVVLFFYPRGDSPVCTVQWCAFRDAYEDVTTAVAEVVGVSSDSATSHRRFAAKRKLPFPILERPGRLFSSMFRAFEHYAAPARGLTSPVHNARERMSNDSLTPDSDNPIARDTLLGGTK